MDRHKQNWLPCEGEAAGIRLVLNHFQTQIRESNHTTTHYTDSQPCVLAWKRARRGAFSTSSRINAFLTGISTLPVELCHKPGKEMFTSDFASRNPPSCQDPRCQICRFTQEWQMIGDNASEIRSLSVEDIKSGKSVMPMIQKSVWKNIQMNDSIHCKLLTLINTRQLPEARKTKGDNTKLKLLHNLYTQGKLFIQDGLFLVKSPGGHFNDAIISVPPAIFPGIANALHIRLDHPSKGQLSCLIARYFYTPGWRTIIEDLTNSCHQCSALRKLPKVLLEDTHTSSDVIASRFAADVIERESQKILIVREHISQYTRGLIIPDQTAETLRQALISLVADIMPDSGTEIRVDGATAFQSLERESVIPDSTLGKLKIKLVVGRLLNKNKNPNAENAVQEVLKEILKLKSQPGPISHTDLSLALRNINSRIRYHSLTPKEILFRRNVLSNQPIEISEQDLLRKQNDQKVASSKSSHKNKSKFKKASPEQEFTVGDLVMLRESRSKTNPRETFIVEQLPTENQPYVLIRKLRNSLRSRLYKALQDELIHVNPAQAKSHANRQRRKAAIEADKKINQAVSLIQTRKPNFKHGWIESDQCFVEDLEPPTYSTYSLAREDPDSDLDSTDTSQSPSSETSSPASHLLNLNPPQDYTSEDEMTWDSSPEQYNLTSTVSNQPDAWSSAPFVPPHVTLPPAFPRDRTYAFTQPPLTRRNAFRLPRLNHAFNSTPANTPRSLSKSRIPLPTSTRDVNLNQVSDVSHANI